MKYTQLLCFEITDRCNLSEAHPRCPNGHPEQYSHVDARRPITDAKILEIARDVHARGFTGYTCWHHYCEPLLAWPRVKALQRQLRELVPGVKFMLWTNGTLLDQLADELKGQVDCLVISNYAGRDWSHASAICDDVRILGGDLDWRLDPPRHAGRERCLRMFVDLTIDYYGNVRPCCWDWRGEISPGNVHTTPWPDLVQRWLSLRAKLARQPMAEDAPARCLDCGTRYQVIGPYDQATAQRTSELLIPEP